LTNKQWIFTFSVPPKIYDFLTKNLLFKNIHYKLCTH